MTSWIKSKIRLIVDVSDKVLVYQAKRGDREAYGKIYQKYLDRLYRYVYFRTNQRRELAEDLTETAFIKAWKAIPEFKNQGGTFQSWLYTIARNTVFDYFRSQQSKLVSLDDNLARKLPDKTNLEEKVIQKDEENILRQAINNLPDQQRQALTMKYIDDLENSEIAAIMGKKEEAIRALQSRGIKKLRQLMPR